MLLHFGPTVTFLLLLLALWDTRTFQNRVLPAIKSKSPNGDLIRGLLGALGIVFIVVWVVSLLMGY